MPQKNPYLSKFKENISNKQKSLREGLIQDINPLPQNHRLEQKQDGDFPSIDDENLETGENLYERRHRSGYEHFNNDAEESLRFFKKNLLPNVDSSFQSKSTYLTSTQQPNSTVRQQRSTGSLFDRQPSLSSVKGESIYVARSRAPLEVAATSRTTNQNNNSNYKSPAKTSNKPITIKDDSHIVSRHIRESATVDTPTIRRSNMSYMQTQPQAERSSSRTSIDQVSNTEQRSSSQPRTRERKADTSQAIAPRQSSSGRRAADDSELVRPNKANNSKFSESPIPSEAFSRKPLYNSLLRAHDSIRLKVNRPKVRPKSETTQVQDTELDDSIQLAEINDGSDKPNERAVDVKRRSSKKKNKTKEVKDHQKVNEDEKSVTPVRNFSEVRVVKIVKTGTKSSFGVTLRPENGNLVVARILAGGLAYNQGALQVGDVILAVNNREVYTSEQLQEELRKANQDDTVLLKIVPSFREELPTLCIYLRALFNYDPNEDTLLPCKEVGVSFNQGDILEVVNQEDPNWWQARRVDSENLQTGLIPSQELEERRRAFVLPDYDLATRTSICGTKVSRKKKKKEIYNVGQNCDFDKAELQLYEEVCRTPGFERRSLVLIGANGVGKQALKARIIAMDPDRFGTPLPHTSRLPRDGEEDGIHYFFVTREKMEEDIIAGKYLEYGEYDGALYGTKLDSVREIIGSGRVCVLDCSPTCLKVLKTSDYLPFVAFIAAPTLDQLRYMHEWNRGNKTYATFDRALSRQSRRAKTLQEFAFDFFEDEDLQITVEESARLFRIYENYFDIVLVNNEFNRTYEALRDAIDALSMAPQWIPISWIYGT